MFTVLAGCSNPPLGSANLSPTSFCALTSIQLPSNIAGRDDDGLRALRKLGLLCLLIVGVSVACLSQDGAPFSAVAPPAQAPTGSSPIDCGRFAAHDAKLDLVSKLCVFALSYRSKLPDFIAQQTTTSKAPNSTVVISAQVTYRQGLEQYSQITINGVTASQSGVDARLFSTGEFGPLLINLFEVPDTVEFKFKKTETLAGVSVAVFDFDLPKKKNGFWAIQDAKGETLKPEFRGRLWLEAQSGRIVREEVEPVTNSWQTGLMSMKLATDYALTQVSDLGTFLLPVRSESTMCRGLQGVSLGCTVNVAVFHDYQKFGASSRVLPAAPEQ